MSAVIQAASALSRAWVRLYTARLPEALRRARRAEVAADLWDHAHDRLAGGTAAGVTATEIVARTCFGAVDDVAWRFDVQRALRRRLTNGRISMLRLTSRQTRWMGLAGLAGGLLWAGYFVSLMQRSRGDFPGAWDLVVPVVVATLVLAGLAGFLSSHRERIGRRGAIGVALLIAGMASYLLANTLLAALPSGTVRTVLGGALAVGFVILPIPGFILTGLSLKGPARAGAFLVAVAGPLGMVLGSMAASSGVNPPWLRGDAPVNLNYGLYFILAAAWLAAAGYSTYRQAQQTV